MKKGSKDKKSFYANEGILIGVFTKKPEISQGNTSYIFGEDAKRRSKRVRKIRKCS